MTGLLKDLINTEYASALLDALVEQKAAIEQTIKIYARNLSTRSVVAREDCERMANALQEYQEVNMLIMGAVYDLMTAETDLENP